MSQIMDVIVIGCGAAGIAAISKLSQAGFQVLGLEASDRIGGRICTVEYGNGLIDLGASWCHGEKNNLVFELANPHGLLAKSTPPKNCYLLSNGDVVSETKAQDIVKSLEAIVSKSDKKNKQSIKDCLRNGLKKYPDLIKNSDGLLNSLLEWYERNNHLGGQSDLNSGKSLRGLVEGIPCEGDFMIHWKGKGFKTILDILLQKIPDPSKEIKTQILTNKEVETIKWKASQPKLEQDSSLVHVKCTDGSLYAAKRVIVTMSIGVLKEKYNQLFNPPLPQDKINTINSLQLCVLDKIYIEFEKPWWGKEHTYFSVLWRPEDKENFSKEDSWINEIYGLWTVENQPNVLLAWIYGDGAKNMEKVSLENVQIGVGKLLKSVFARQYTLTPIKSVLRSQWASNSLIKGAYSYRSVATEESDGSAKTLSEPLYIAGSVPTVCFAGEATSINQHGAVHGAIESGYREAKRIIASFK